MLSPYVDGHPGDLDLAFVLGSALVHTSNITDGVTLLERVGQRGPSGDAYLLAGSTLLKANENARALEDLQAAARLNIHPNSLRRLIRTLNLRDALG